MKLISCRVENFGAISGKDFDFSDGLTCIEGENGTGKTTLARFIKSMFYGMPSFKSNTKTFCDRQHFYPFSGGKFGGNLTFEHCGKTYRIERFFDKMSAVRDEMKVYRGSEITDELGAEPGRTVFGLDEGSFSRTLFLSDGETDGDVTGISAALGGLVYDADGDDFKNAVKGLQNAAKTYKAARGGGLISQEKEKRKNLRDEIEDIKKVDGGLAQSYARRSELTRRIDMLEGELKKEQELRLAREKRATYERYLGDIEAKKRRAEEISARYGGAVPPLEELLKADEECVEYANNCALMKGAEIPEQRRARLGELSEKFSRLTDDDKKQIDRLTQSLSSPPAELPAAEKSGGSKRKPVIYIIFCALAVMFLAAGAGVCFVSVAGGAILLAAGVLALAVTGFLYLKTRLDAAARPIPQNAAEESAESVKLRAVLFDLGYKVPNAQAAASEFYKDFGEYEALKKEFSECEQRLRGIREENARIVERVDGVIMKYSLENGGGRRRAVALATDDSREYARLAGEIAELEERAENYRINNCAQEPPEREDYPGDAAADLSAARRELGALDIAIQNEEEYAGTLTEKEGELEETEEKLKIYGEKYEIFSAAAEFLQSAERTLREKYISPVKDRFSYYAGKTCAALGERMVMDKDFNVSFERGGEIRSDKHLSAGQRAVCDLCLRLALTDNLFGGEKPFYVMDDPFAALDSVNFGGVAKVVKALAEDRQIIYFCCHPSRKI